MKIIFTGASSFTGYWFVRELVRAGHEVVATFTKGGVTNYEGLRKRRVERIIDLCPVVYNCPFGSEAFVKLVGSERFDAVCHHGADVANYQDRSFDVVKAVASNTHGAAIVGAAMKHSSCKVFVLTGSIFENGEGAGSDGLKPFSAYGLSKYLTYQVFEYHCRENGITLGKFVIPNPFGPFEEERFTSYLIHSWMKGGVAEIRTPDYVRDNIHASLLSRAYVYFIAALNKDKPGFIKINPSGYVGTQGFFAQTVATEMRKRLHVPCEYILKKQDEFLEPRIRINTDCAAALIPEWNEGKAWDELAHYYSEKHRL